MQGRYLLTVGIWFHLKDLEQKFYTDFRKLVFYDACVVQGIKMQSNPVRVKSNITTKKSQVEYLEHLSQEKPRPLSSCNMHITWDICECWSLTVNRSDGLICSCPFIHVACYSYIQMQQIHGRISSRSSGILFCVMVSLSVFMMHILLILLMKVERNYFGIWLHCWYTFDTLSKILKRQVKARIF